MLESHDKGILRRHWEIKLEIKVSTLNYCVDALVILWSLLDFANKTIYSLRLKNNTHTHT